ncbi:MAG: gamma-butyrobetaine hydroxylase-like domain-containing protein [Salinibacter sp.]
MDVPNPSRIQVDTDAQTLTIEWADGHTATFPLTRLRAACPCAECGGKAVDHIPPPTTADASPDRQWNDLDIEPAGSIGIRITWDDGHNAGIFRWDRLRRLQPKREE